jgi:hypothetical protein
MNDVLSEDTDERIVQLEHRFINKIWSDINGHGFVIDNRTMFTDSHLAACIKFIEERGSLSAYGYGGRWLRLLIEEANSRGVLYAS